MEATKYKRSVMVGLFVAIGIVIFLVGVFTLGGQQKAFVKTVSVAAVFDDVSGLQEGNNVWFSGVKIGTVKKIEFFNKSQVKVTLHIEHKAQPYIRKDAKAKIGSDGFIGSKIIVIYGGSPDSPAIKGNENLAIEASLDTDDMLATLQKNNENLLSITSDFKAVSEKLAAGQGSLGALLNERALYNELAAVVANLHTAARNSEKLTGRIAEYTTKLQAPGTLVGDLVNDTIIFANLRAATDNLNIASGSAVALVDNLKDVTANLDENDNAVGVLLHDEKVAADLKTIVENLNSSSKKLDENMEALQHNFLLRGYFKKKAKREAKAMEDSTKGK
ncbi:MAG TPA: MlaD family protein [Agriterribacter sp.]|nr:MlaD family protein [Agriterribacter sp.]